MSIAGRRRSSIGPGHDGKPKRNFFAKPGKPALDIHHTPAITNGEKRTTTRGHVALDGAPKRHLPVPTSSGMTERQRQGAGVGGMAHATAVDSGGQPASSPLAKPALANTKHGKLVPTTPGMKRRTDGPGSTVHSMNVLGQGKPKGC